MKPKYEWKWFKENNHLFNEWFSKYTYNYHIGVNFLFRYCSKYFDIWWDIRFLKVDDCIYNLASKCSDHFDKWYDPKMMSESDSRYIISNCSYHFDKWYVDVDYKLSQDILAKSHQSKFDIWWTGSSDWDFDNSIHIGMCSDHFDKWYDPKNYYEYSILAKHCPDHFDKWYGNANADDIAEHLIKYCMDHFDKWWPDITIYQHVDLMVKYSSQKIDVWWPEVSHTINKNDYNVLSISLCVYCFKSFDVWWDKTAFNYKYTPQLFQYCNDYFVKWYNPNNGYMKREWDVVCKYFRNDYIKWVKTQSQQKQLKLLQLLD